MRRLLLPLTPLYRAVVWGRNEAYDAGLIRSKKVSVPVIAVGNIATGGTGKTPLVEEVAKRCIARGVNVGVLSRGYGRRTTGFRWVQKGEVRSADPFECGDEPLQIAANVPEAIVAVDEDRFDGARRLIDETSIDLLVLDDAYQHRRIERDLDLVTVSRNELEGNDTLLPAGNLREPLASLNRADVIVVTGVAKEEHPRMLALVRRWFTGTTLFAGTEPERWSTFDGDHRPPTGLSGKRVVALTGIARPERFRATLETIGCDICAHERKPDHHFFSLEEVLAVERLRHRHGADVVVTTQKDAMRLRSVARDADIDPKLWTYLSIGLRWLSDEAVIDRMIQSLMTGPKKGS